MLLQALPQTGGLFLTQHDSKPGQVLKTLFDCLFKRLKKGTIRHAYT